MPLASGVWTRARLSVMDPNGGTHDVNLVCADGGTSCCEARQIAQDSVLLWSVPAVSKRTWRISGVGRMDFAVKCTTDASLVWVSGSVRLFVDSSLAGTNRCE